ncbi:MAG: U32 family peptidase, partial [Candidatus Magasanikbacteria bacterium]|nr:U32 family peptidase [Candidatus Magasanikbacteria bacterium]
NIFLGPVKSFFVQANVGEFQMETGELSVGEEILVTGPTTGAFKMVVEELRVDGEPAKKAVKGDLITIKTNSRVRKSDKLFVVRDRVKVQ